MISDWLTIPEAAGVLRCSPSHIKTLLGQRGGPVELGFHKCGRRTYIKRAEVERYIAQAEASGVMRSPRFKGKVR